LQQEGGAERLGGSLCPAWWPLDECAGGSRTRMDEAAVLKGKGERADLCGREGRCRMGARGVFLLPFSCLLLAMFSAFAQSGQSYAATPSEVQQPRGPYTPPRGSSERSAILNPLLVEIKRLHRADVTFAVEYLRVHRGWAWVQTRPLSPDGAQRYDGVSALLHSDQGAWRVVEIACAEEGNENCVGSKGYFDGLKGRFPAVPRDIFPKER
jgi:hypothetical protein